MKIKPIYTPKQRDEAIKARANGEWDNKQLMKLGPLSVSKEADMRRIRELTIGYWDLIYPVPVDKSAKA